MARTINIDKIGKLIGEEPYKVAWFNYRFDASWGSSMNSKSKKLKGSGQIIQAIDKDISIQKVMKCAKNGDFDEIAGFYPAIFLFFGEKFINKVDFCDGNGRHRISRLIDSLKGPSHLKSDICDFVRQDFDFLAFLEACGRNEKLIFDLETAISVYKLQGDDAIFSLICQIFYINKRCDGFSVCLKHDLPVILPIEISDYMSGCNFPVAVSPAISDMKWQNTPNGHFLYGKLDEKWLCMDVVSSGFVNLSNYALTNRLNYLGGGGECLPYVICWNWGEILDAKRHFGENMLIRDLKNTIFNHYWFIFSPKTLINVRFKENFINTTQDYKIKPDFDAENIVASNSGIAYLTINLQGDFVSYCQKNDVFFSDAEVYDVLELGKMAFSTVRHS